MRITTIISLSASAVLGIAAMLLVRNMIGNANTTQPAPTAAALQTVSIVVAAHEIAFGDALKAGHLVVVQWPEENVPKGAFSSLAPFKEDNKTWRSALVRMAKNEPVLDFKVSGEGQRQSLSLQIGIDMRAFAIRTNQASGVGGFVLPGDSVDVLLVRQIDGEAGNKDKAVSDLIVQNVRVLGVDQNADATSEKTRVAKTVTIEVGALDAQRLALADELGDLTLTLRRAGSEKIMSARQITIADLKATRPIRAVTRRKNLSRKIKIAVIRPQSRELVSVFSDRDSKKTTGRNAKNFARIEKTLVGAMQP